MAFPLLEKNSRHRVGRNEEHAEGRRSSREMEQVGVLHEGLDLVQALRPRASR